MPFILPPTIHDALVTRLLRRLTAVDSDEPLTIDFSRVGFYEPGAVIALLTRLRHWKEKGRQLSATGIRQSPSKRYLQRIDFFAHLGIHLEEDFERLPAQSRFVEICRIKNSQVNALASKVARCMASQCEEPEEIRSCFAYILGELIANVDQHSGGAGFLSAQHYPDKGSIHVAVGDCGVGIRRSFEGTHLEEQLRTPRAALEKALEPTVSSALLRPPSGPYQGRNNRGLGLSMISKLISETHGQFRLFTENAVYEQIGDVSFKFDETSHTHPGTLASLSINTDEITNFNEVIGEISNRVEPSELDEWDEMFESPKDELDSSP